VLGLPVQRKTQELVLTATQGLSADSIGRVRLKLGEGLTGQALKELRPIREGTGNRSPQYKFIPGILEERYQAFLAVPIMRGLDRVGVLVLQDPVADYFDENDTKALQAIAAQLAATIENAKLLLTLHQLQESTLADLSAPGPARSHGAPAGIEVSARGGRRGRHRHRPGHGIRRPGGSTSRARARRTLDPGGFSPRPGQDRAAAGSVAVADGRAAGRRGLHDFQRPPADRQRLQVFRHHGQPDRKGHDPGARH
jgi:putative methionine-R-sulfoxide reductase with GAF domain